MTTVTQLSSKITPFLPPLIHRINQLVAVGHDCLIQSGGQNKDSPRMICCLAALQDGGATTET